MKIAFVSDRCAPYYLGGYEQRLWEFARRLAGAGHDVSILTTCDSSHIVEGVKFVAVSPASRSYFGANGFRRLRDNLAFTMDLLWHALSHRVQYDVVDANATPWVHLPIAYLLARVTRARFVVTAHEALLDSMRPYFQAKRSPLAIVQGRSAELYYRLSQGLAETIIAASPSAVRSLQAEGYRAPIIAVPSGQDPAPSCFVDFHARSSMHVLFVGRHVQMKRIDVLLEAAAKLPDVRFSILGDGPMTGELKSVAERKGLANVSFLGRVSEEEKRKHLLSAEVFVMPSYREGWSLATVEAMAHGCAPVFAYRPERYETGVATYVRDGDNGFAFDGSASDLVRKLSTLRDEPELRTRMRKLAYDDSMNFSWDSALASLVNAYELRDEESSMRSLR